MSATAARGQTAPDASAVAFELERYELVDQSVEVGGRWYGVRGRRFVRPTLTVGESQRVLAVLDHKPWSAEDGEFWLAAFPWEGELAELAGAELAVAPDIAVPLSPRNGQAGERVRTAPRASSAAPRDGKRRPVQRRRDATAGETASLRAQVGALERELVEQRARVSELKLALEAAEAAQAKATSALAGRDVALARLEESIAERDSALGVAKQAENELHAARSAARGIAAERDEALAERNALRADREMHRSERDELRAERDRLRAERDGLRGERDRIRSERDELRAERDRLQHERGEPQATEVAAPTPAPVRRLAPAPPSPLLVRLAAALAVLTLFVILAVIVVSS